jgi:hypothetical protein
MKEIIEHKIVKEKDYTGTVLNGFFWFIIVSIITAIITFIIKEETGSEIWASIMGTLCFCYGIYAGRGFFKCEEVKTVEHIIRRIK